MWYKIDLIGDNGQRDVCSTRRDNGEAYEGIALDELQRLAQNRLDWEHWTNRCDCDMRGTKIYGKVGFKEQCEMTELSKWRPFSQMNVDYRDSQARSSPIQAKQCNHKPGGDTAHHGDLVPSS